MLKGGFAPDRIAGDLRQAIFGGEFQPGDPLPEMHLAKRYGVSQATIRDALARLTHDGLVRRVPNRGTHVTTLSPKEVTEHLRLRVVLEGIAASDAGQYATAKDFELLQEILERLGLAAAANDYYGAGRADLEFHRQIWRLSQDGTLYRLLDQITMPLFAFVSMRRSRSREELTKVMLSHDPILRALRSRDGALIRDTLRVHIENSYLSFLQAGACWFGVGPRDDDS